MVINSFKLCYTVQGLVRLLVLELSSVGFPGFPQSGGRIFAVANGRTSIDPSFGSHVHLSRFNPQGKHPNDIQYPLIPGALSPFFLEHVPHNPFRITHHHPQSFPRDSEEAEDLFLGRHPMIWWSNEQIG